ncbi:hypothetical protein SCAR479_05084 [Seiridium cardinale]|uniref:Uncharacterized protein n=1 Tax=Seiridium cardinale TaxID=138064 RepID=A0ABR2XWB6_9PEZI
MLPMSSNGPQRIPADTNSTWHILRVTPRSAYAQEFPELWLRVDDIGDLARSQSIPRLDHASGYSAVPAPQLHSSSALLEQTSLPAAGSPDELQKCPLSEHSIPGLMRKPPLKATLSIDISPYQSIRWPEIMIVQASALTVTCEVMITGGILYRPPYA